MTEILHFVRNDKAAYKALLAQNGNAVYK